MIARKMPKPGGGKAGSIEKAHTIPGEKAFIMLCFNEAEQKSCRTVTLEGVGGF